MSELGPVTVDNDQLAPRNSEEHVDHASAGAIKDVSPEHTLVRVNEDPLLMNMAIHVAQTTLHACSLCSKVFSTVNALNKHTLTHQQDRPHVCPTCQRAFKRQDHLTSHLVTHQKKKPLRCIKPDCQKSYNDAYSLKLHHSLHHQVYFTSKPNQSISCRPLDTNPAQWKVLYNDVDPFLGSSADYSDCCSIYLSPFNFELGSVGDFEVMSFPGSSAPSILDAWHQGECKGVCVDNEDKTHQHKAICGTAQQTNNLKPEPSATSTGPHCREGALDIPVSEFQTLEEVLFQPCVEAERSRGDFTVQSDCAKKSRRPAIVLKQTPCEPKQEFKKKSLPKTQALPFLCVQDLCFSESSAVLHSVTGDKDEPTFNDSKKTQPIIHPPAASGSYSAVQPETTGSTTLTNEGRKVRVKKKLNEASVPAPPLPPSHPSIHYVRRCVRPRPLHLLSPSQVAMASFSVDSSSSLHTSCPGLKVFTAGDEQNISLRVQTVPHSSEHGCQPLSQSGPSRRGNEEYFYPESKAAGGDLGEQLEQKEQEPLMPLVIPVSVPVTEQAGHADRESQKPESFTAKKAHSSAGASKKTRRFKFMKTLFIPSPMGPQTYLPLDLQEDSVGCQWYWAAGGYPSQLRSSVYLGDQLWHPSFQPPPYTPPPMLSPLRPGTGLYFNTLAPLHPCPLPLSTYTATVDAANGIALVMDDTVVTIQPRINVGSRFQAEIPPLQNLVQVLYEEHPAHLVWAPCGGTGSSVDYDQRVKGLLDLCSSSALPGGGTNLELALHCLHEARGDILAALEMLLTKGDYRSHSHPMQNYHYFGSHQWSAQEKRLFRRALITHGKNFQVIQSMLQRKSVAQCVEYYYAMKKLKKFKQQFRQTGKKGLCMDSVCKLHTVEALRGQAGRLAKRGGSRKAQLVTAAVRGHSEFTCEKCGRAFGKVRSYSAHMKTHRQQEREWPVTNNSSGICS